MNRIASSALAIAVGAILAAPVYAKDKKKGEEPPPEPPPAAKYRHTVMDSIGGHFKATMMILHGQVDRPDDLQSHATALHEMSLVLDPSLWPEGTGPGDIKTRSLAAIWEQPDEFQAAIDAFREESSKLVLVSRTGDMAAFQEQFKALGGACGNCHDSFRAEEE